MKNTTDDGKKLLWDGDNYLHQNEPDTTPTVNYFDYNNPIKKEEIGVISFEDNGKSKITRFTYNGKYYTQKYNYGPNYGFKFLFEYDTAGQQINHLRQVGERIIYSTTLESNCTPFGKYLEYSLSKMGGLTVPETKEEVVTDVSMVENFTGGEWRIIPARYSRKTDVLAWDINAVNKEGTTLTPICSVVPKELCDKDYSGHLPNTYVSVKEAEANAQRIVLAVNNFDAMYIALKRLIEASKGAKDFLQDTGTIGGFLNLAIDESEAILNRITPPIK